MGSRATTHGGHVHGIRPTYVKIKPSHEQSKFEKSSYDLSSRPLDKHMSKVKFLCSRVRDELKNVHRIIIIIIEVPPNLSTMECLSSPGLMGSRATTHGGHVHG